MSTHRTTLSAALVAALLVGSAAIVGVPPAPGTTPAGALTPVASATTAVPAEGDGFLFSGGVRATLLNRVVRMAPDTPAAIRSLVAEVVRQINASSGAGVTIGADTTSPPGTTEIVVRAPSVTICGPSAAGCASNAVATVEGYGVVVNALVEIDRDLLGSGYELPILLHEMGHAMGLGHYDQPYGGRMQVMWNSVTPDMTTYRDGDRNGLSALGAVFTNRNVIGNIERVDLVPGGVRVRGWTLDLDAAELALGVSASLDGTQTPGTADAYRPDIGAAFPGAGDNHGVDLVVPTTGLSGAVTMCLVATGGRGQGVGIGCRATTAAHSPLGHVDVARQRGPGAIEMAGWAFDPDSAGPTTIEVSVDGIVVATDTTDVNRSDVTAAYPGFPGTRGWALSLTGVAAGSRRVCTRALDSTGDPGTSLGCRTVAVGGGNPIGTVDAITPGPSQPLTIRGWAIDPDTVAPTQVHLYIDGRYSRSGTADLRRPDVGGAYPGYGDNHGFAVALPGLARGRHVACVFAINRLAGTQNSLLGCRSFTTVGLTPIGNVDGVATVDGRPSLVGWSIDPDTTRSISVHAWANGRFLTSATANRLRPDVGRAYPAYGSRHGFALRLDRLAPGRHQVCAYGINAGTNGPNPLLGCRWVRIS